MTLLDRSVNKISCFDYEIIKKINKFFICLIILYHIYFFFHLKVEVFKNILATTYDIIEPSHGKTNNVVSDQVRHKSSCTVTEAG